mgnify:CR=1 FL=1
MISAPSLRLMNRLLALLAVFCLVIGPPRATSLVRAGDDTDPTEQKEDPSEDAKKESKEDGKEAECSFGAEFALARRPWTHPALHAVGAAFDSPPARSLSRATAFAPHPEPPLARLPRRQI